MQWISEKIVLPSGCSAQFSVVQRVLKCAIKKRMGRVITQIDDDSIAFAFIICVIKWDGFRGGVPSFEVVALPTSLATLHW